MVHAVWELDLREGPKGSKDRMLTINEQRSSQWMDIESISIPRYKPWLLAAGGSDPWMRLYDRRMLPACRSGGCTMSVQQFSSSEAERDDLTVTGVSFAEDGSQVLVNYSGKWVISDIIRMNIMVRGCFAVPQLKARAPYISLNYTCAYCAALG